MLFTVKWPRLGVLEAAMLFPVAIATVGEVAASHFGLDAGFMASGGGLFLLALTAVVAVPYLGLLMAVDRLLVIRKGFAILACLATVVWAGSAALLSDGFATLLGIQGTSFHGTAALIAGAASLLAHLKFLLIGLQDTGFAAMQMGVEPRVDADQRMQSGRYMTAEELSHDEDDRRESPEMARRRKRMFRKLADTGGIWVPVETGLALILVGGLMYGSYCWIYSGNHGSGVEANDSMPVAVNSYTIPQGPVIDGAAGTGRDSAGRFVFDATVNGTTMRMVYDDDTRLVTLRAEDALRIGISFAKLDFADKIKTDKGTIEVAGITIGAMSVGSITYRLVPGYVARQGALDTSILGHSFLGRLATSRFQDNQIRFTGTR
jgi:clan AA aspartic protease (TIGR02281 family)